MNMGKVRNENRVMDMNTNGLTELGDEPQVASINGKRNERDTKEVRKNEKDNQSIICE